MPRTGERGGPQTRRRIAGIASKLFLDRGFDAVTVAEVAKAAGVSSVTVFNHFPRKEDLFLDRSLDASELLLSTVRGRAEGVDAISALRTMALGLLDERHALSGTDPRSAPFFRTVAESPALVARARELAAELGHTLGRELAADPRLEGDAELLAALFIAGYATVVVAGAQQILAGASPEELLDSQRARFVRLFDVLGSGFGAR